MGNEVFLLLGTNLGNTADNLKKAIYSISLKATVLRLSPVYRTKAWGLTDQPDFYNQVLHVQTNQDPEKFLDEILSIELELGRERKEKWGPRIIDIDILLFDNLVINNEKLTLPHPGIPSRRFVLVPLMDLIPEYIHPVLNKSIKKLWEECTDKLAVGKII